MPKCPKCKKEMEVKYPYWVRPLETCTDKKCRHSRRWFRRERNDG